MADFVPQNDLWSAGTVGAVSIAILQILQSYGYQVTNAVFSAVPLFSGILASYIHNVISSRKPPA